MLRLHYSNGSHVNYTCSQNLSSTGIVRRSLAVTSAAVEGLGKSRMLDASGFLAPLSLKCMTLMSQALRMLLR